MRQLKCLSFYKNEVENQFCTKIKAIRSDRGGKYCPPFEQFCLEHGIIHQTTTPYSHLNPMKLLNEKIEHLRK